MPPIPQPPLGRGWEIFKQRRIAECIAIAHHQGGIGEARMKSGAPWTDQTGNARNGLSSKVEVENETIFSIAAGAASMSSGFVRVRLFFFHTMEYGKWLETVLGAAHGKRRNMSEEALASPENIGPYAIIHPTVQAIYPDYRNAILSRWRGGFRAGGSQI